MAFIRSISGLRATIVDDLTPEIITKYCLAFSKMLPVGAVVIGNDSRPTGKWIEKVAAEAIASTGRDVRLLGVVPTPTVQLMTEHSDAAGGIAITASHNPSEWNGLKFINSSGIFLDAEKNKTLWDIVDNNEYESISNACGTINYIDNAISEHIKRILNIPLFNDENLKYIVNKHFKVVVDAVNASGSKAIPTLLRNFGCEVIELYCEGNGEFPHVPEPLAVNLDALSERTKSESADFGLAVDPDADRLVLVDNKGEVLSEEYTVAIASLVALNNISYFTNYAKCAVINHSSSMITDYVAKVSRAEVHRSAVGEINVVKKMKETNAVIGGEGSGGVILPACHYGRDSLVGTALTLYFLSNHCTKLTELYNYFPKYKMIKLKKVFNGSLTNIIDRVLSAFPDADIIREDGIKVVYSDSWIQLRASNTEPIIRIIAESTKEEDAQPLIARILSLID